MPFRPNILACLALALTTGAVTLACGGSTDAGMRSEESTVVTPRQTPSVGVSVASASLGRGTANVQLAFVAADGATAAAVSVRSVVLIDASKGTVVDRLDASSPSVWNGQTYEPWNEKVTPGGDLRASYTLSAPDWNAIGGDERSSMSTPYKLRITLAIEGVETVVESGELQREPEMVT